MNNMDNLRNKVTPSRTSKMSSSSLLIFALFLSFQLNAQQPNILWLSCEDISPMLSMYGDKTAETPNLDKLASESLIFNEAYTTVGVCAPSRSSIITGQYPVSIGTHQMRTGRDVYGWGSRKYDGKSNHYDINRDYIPRHSVVTPPETKCFTEYLRANGYFCTNNAKTDCQFAIPVTAYDENGRQAHWKNRKENQPFFAVFNHDVTHESKTWMHKDYEMTVDPNAVPLPDYFPDTKTVRTDVARVYSNIELLDKQIGEKIGELEEAGLLDNTIIFFFSDHGGPLPRGKRAHYVSGLKVPFMVRLPKDLKQKYINDPISFVDLGPTVLSLAGIPIPNQMQGQAFLGNQKTESTREYIFGSGDRFDEYADRIRSVISKEFVYVKNYHPELPAYKDVAYRRNINMTNEMLEMNEKGDLNGAQSYWFRKTKTKEELYVRADDSYSLNNVIDDKKYKKPIKKMRKALKRWQKEIGDIGHIPEKEHLEKMWPNGIQPKTVKPMISESNGKATLTCSTKGSSIAYLISEEEIEPNLDSGWMVYSKPLDLKKGEILYVMGTRLGFKDSEVVSLKK